MKPAVIVVTFGFLSSSIALAQAQSNLDAGTIYKRSLPSVVKIEAYNDKNQPEWTGSGFVVASDGKLLTNFHVIRNSKKATVRLGNGDAYDDVQVIDVDKRRDIALLKIKAIDLAPLTLGSSGGVQVGDAVYSLGNPLGLANTLSNGIVSAIRPMDGYRLLQITAPISGGSSGGPLFDSHGAVIGITVATLEGGQNLNFAVPIDYAKGILAAPGTPKALETVYDAEPVAAEPTKPSAPVTTSVPPPAPSGPTASIAEPSASLRQELSKGVIPFLSSKLLALTEADARALFGDPRAHRPFYDVKNTVVGDIYDWSDSTGQTAHFELTFDIKTSRMTNVFIYPSGRLTWTDAKRLWGDKANEVKNPNGTKSRSYTSRRLNLTLDKDDNVLVIGLY
jgi:hypothetical protein